MAWQLTGTYFENCNCDTVCPCTTSGFAQRADNDRCLPTFAINVESGNVDGLDVSGLTTIMVFDTPPLMADGGWEAGLIIDSAASDEQADALGRVFGGQVGGPMAALAPLIGTMLGVERASIEYSNDGLKHSVKAGDAVDIEIEDVQLGEGVPAAGLTNVMFHPMGPDLTIARASRATINAFGKVSDNAGKNGHAAPFTWSA